MGWERALRSLRRRWALEPFRNVLNWVDSGLSGLKAQAIRADILLATQLLTQKHEVLTIKASEKEE